MEAMGLVVIVLLILIGIFLLVFLGKPKDTNKATAYNQKLIESYVSTLAKTKITCGAYELVYNDLVRACMTGAAPSCLGTALPCDYLKLETGKILNSSINKWGYSYTYNLTTSAGETTIGISSHTPDENNITSLCTKKPRKVAAELPVSLSASGGGEAFLRLRVCY
jgi:hypothetical protein